MKTLMNCWKAHLADMVLGINNYDDTSAVMPRYDEVATKCLGVWLIDRGLAMGIG